MEYGLLEEENKIRFDKNTPNGHDLSTGYEIIKIYINSLVDNKK